MLKKVILMLAAVLLVAISAGAVTPAELQGTKWKSKKMEMPSEDEMLKANMVVEYVFDADGKFSEKQEVTMSIYDRETKMRVDMYISVSGSGDYTAAGDSITLKSDPSTLKVECEDEDIRVTFAGGESNAIMESMIKSQMKPMITAMEEEIKKGLKEPSVLKDVVINGKKATATNDGAKAEFSIKKI